MEIKWKPGGGVQILDLTAQEWGWLQRELKRTRPEVTRDAGDEMVDQIKKAAPVDATTIPKPADLSKPVL